jgi:hypothetical protein
MGVKLRYPSLVIEKGNVLFMFNRQGKIGVINIHTNNVI